MSNTTFITGLERFDADRYRASVVQANLRPTLQILRLHPNAILPRYQTAGAACFDLHSIGGAVVPRFGVSTFMTGFAYAVPEGFAMLIYSRSGHGFKHGIRLANGTGVIDSDYRGEIMIKLTNDSAVDFVVEPGDRIAQAKVTPVQQWHLQEVSALGSTERGTQGFGSTGA